VLSALDNPIWHSLKTRTGRSAQIRFEFCRPFQGVSSVFASRSRIPPKRVRMRYAEPSAEIRMSFRCLSRRHLSVVLRATAKNV